MTKIMATEIHEEIVLTDDSGETILKFYITAKKDIAISEDDTDNPYAFFTTLSKSDWEDIKSFIDTQINS